MSSTTADTRERAFERMYRSYGRDVYRFALALVRNPDDAEDLTQTTFLNAYRAFARGDEPARTRSWLFAIAHNAVRSGQRWTLRRPREVPFESEEYRLAAREDERDGIVDVLRALDELPANQRAALALRELEGRSYSEISETLGVSVPAVESLIARARRTLRKQRANFRGLGLAQVLRDLLQRGDAVAVKAAAVVAAATVVAGGVGVATHDDGASNAAAARERVVQPRASVLLPVGVARHAGRAAAARPRAAAEPRRSSSGGGPAPVAPDGAAARTAPARPPSSAQHVGAQEPPPASAPPPRGSTSASAPAVSMPPGPEPPPELPGAPALPNAPLPSAPAVPSTPVLPSPPVDLPAVQPPSAPPAPAPVPALPAPPAPPALPPLPPLPAPPQLPGGIG